jgi:hypothetical protein
VTPGIYYDLPDEVYRQEPAANYSTLKKMAVPALARYERDHPKPPSPAMVLGSAVDCYLLEPDRFADTYEVPEPGDKSWPNATCPVCGAQPLAPCTTKKGEPSKRCCAGRRELHDAGSKRVLSWEQWQQVQSIVGAVRSHRHARTMIELSRHQVSLFWTDKWTGINCKARLDMAAKGWLGDLKTCGAGMASRGEWPRHAWKLGYQYQVALYSDGWQALTGELLPWLWLCVETSAPHLIGIHRAAEAWLIRGRELYRQALRTWAECEASGEWPGYPSSDEPEEVWPPTWLPRLPEQEDEEVWDE